jgi:hypothetical protein
MLQTTCKCTKAMAQTSFLNSSRSLSLQAADFLAIEGHVKDTCSALAARIFPEGPINHSIRTEDDSTQVLIFKRATRFVCCLVIWLQERTISHCFQHVLITLPTAVLFLLFYAFKMWPKSVSELISCSWFSSPVHDMICCVGQHSLWSFVCNHCCNGPSRIRLTLKALVLV